MAKLTQTAVIREAKLWGIRLVSRDGYDPESGGLSTDDITPGKFSCVLGKPDMSLHEVVHGILGKPPRDLDYNSTEDLLVEPLERALHWALGVGRSPTQRDIAQLTAAGLWGKSGGHEDLVRCCPNDEDWQAAEDARNAWDRSVLLEECMSTVEEIKKLIADLKGEVDIRAYTPSSPSQFGFKYNLWLIAVVRGAPSVNTIRAKTILAKILIASDVDARHTGQRSNYHVVWAERDNLRYELSSLARLTRLDRLSPDVRSNVFYSHARPIVEDWIAERGQAWPLDTEEVCSPHWNDVPDISGLNIRNVCRTGELT